MPKPEVGRVGRRKEQGKEAGGRKEERLYSAIFIIFSLFTFPPTSRFGEMKYHKNRTLYFVTSALMWLLGGESVSSSLLQRPEHQ